MPRFTHPGKRLKVVPRPGDIQRFLRKVKVQAKASRPRLGPCWLWRGGHADESGYGQFHFDGRVLWAHRFAYALFRGTIPADLQIDHKCHNPNCVNPHHLRRKTKGANSAESNRYRAKALVCAGAEEEDDEPPF
jgi:hypothetical protein